METPSELEYVMKKESINAVQKFFDKPGGNEMLYLMLKKSQMQGSKKAFKNMVEKIEKKYKIKSLENT